MNDIETPPIVGALLFVGFLIVGVPFVLFIWAVNIGIPKSFGLDVSQHEKS